MQHRFTLSQHITGSEPHFDFFLDHPENEKLWTWQIMEMEPLKQVLSGNSNFFQVPALRIFDHRKIYLDYEGGISGDRGEIRKNDSGNWDWIAQTSKNFTIYV